MNELVEGTCLAGKYTLRKPLGAGGMGLVFEAVDAEGRLVAVKTLKVGAGATPDARARFAREIDAATALVHPNVLALLNHGVDASSGVPFLVMPLVAGGDLGKALTDAGVLEPNVAVSLVLQACRGVAAGHRAGIVHRDLKPSNLFLAEEAGALVVKVSDFGLAKVQHAGIDSLTNSGTSMGSPHYMAPEQAEDAKRVDARADVYALGMILYRALTGAPAFTSSGAFMGFLVGRTTPKHVQSTASWVTPELARVVHAALLRSPDARLPNMDEFELALTMAVGYSAANAKVSMAALRSFVPGATQATTLAPLPSHWEELLRR
jgi:serine/threonine-protein kinase